jgi:Beta-propeller repeat
MKGDLMKTIAKKGFRFSLILLLFVALTSCGGSGGGSSPVNQANQGTWTGTKQLGTAGLDFGYGVAVDSSGNVYVTGYTEGGLDGNTSAGNFDIFLVKYDSAGTKQWTRQLGTTEWDVGSGVAVDSSGNAYVTGYTPGGLDGNTSAGGEDIFLVKYDSNGVKQ